MFTPFGPGNPSVHEYIAAVRGQDPGQDLDCRGFPCAVRSDITDEFAFFDLKGKILQGCDGLLFPQQMAFLPLFADGKGLLKMIHLYITHSYVPPPDAGFIVRNQTPSVNDFSPEFLFFLLLACDRITAEGV